MSLSPDQLNAARALLADELSPRSLAHCERVGATSRSLAMRFGVDPDLAELAGLLHDRARDETDEQLLRSAGELGLDVLPVERERPYLLHARVAAARARREIPGLDAAVLEAVESHTVGSANMSSLDKVVYIADMIEPARTYAGVDELRATCATESLDECFRAGYGLALGEVLAKGRPVHPVSPDVIAMIERETGRDLQVTAVRA